MAKYEIVKVLVSENEEKPELPDGCEPFGMVPAPMGVFVWCKKEVVRVQRVEPMESKVVAQEAVVKPAAAKKPAAKKK